MAFDSVDDESLGERKIWKDPPRRARADLQPTTRKTEKIFTTAAATTHNNNNSNSNSNSTSSNNNCGGGGGGIKVAAAAAAAAAVAVVVVNPADCYQSLSAPRCSFVCGLLRSALQSSRKFSAKPTAKCKAVGFVANSAGPGFLSYRNSFL